MSTERINTDLDLNDLYIAFIHLFRTHPGRFIRTHIHTPFYYRFLI